MAAYGVSMLLPLYEASGNSCGWPGVQLKHNHAWVSRPPLNAFSVKILLDSWQQLGLIANAVQTLASDSLDLPGACNPFKNKGQSIFSLPCRTSAYITK